MLFGLVLCQFFFGNVRGYFHEFNDIWVGVIDSMVSWRHFDYFLLN